MVAREDYDGTHFSATYKEMPNGEERWRIKPVGLLVHSLHISRAMNQSWQKPHFHPGLTESYLVCSGRLIFVSWNAALDDIATGEMQANDGIFMFLPQYRHNIFTTAETEFMTWQQGTLTPNPERNGQDWWPVTAVPLRIQTLMDELTIRFWSQS